MDPDKRLPLETFVACGEWFQQRAVADVGELPARRIELARDGFRLTLRDGEVGSAEVEIISRGDIHWLDISANGATQKTFRRQLREALASPSEVGPFPLRWLVEVSGVVRHTPAALREENSRGAA